MAKKKATRRPKTDLVPTTRCGNTWTEAAFWGFIRSHIRRMSRRWDPCVSAVYERSKRAYTAGINKRQKWEYQCAACFRWFLKTDVQADHIIPCGSIKSFADIGSFVERLLVEVDGFQLLCKPCHNLKTKAEREARANNETTTPD